MRLECESAIRAPHLAAANEIIDELQDSENDIFVILPNAINYLKGLSDESKVEGLEIFYHQVNTRIKTIREQVSLESIFNHLERQLNTTLPINAKVSLIKLIEEVKGILITGKIEDRKAWKILDI